ncbi:uncharacterized protein N7459_001623 [Penicillium hispanicum]|uniref:uncharacterized protein n=1 Tax=Penicillium hispanicum TaxID=1080232 RepID=UPI00253FE9DB|nr:uncharacterized protein N7459_001623 [Penicillium hispanicum]KAJ5595415.1 hypothetical protein N7459_001623 [Penicillium hispanicum]
MSQYAFPGTKSYRSPPSGSSFKPRYGRRSLPLVVAVGLGFVAYNYYTDAKSQLERATLEEEQRLARNQQLMDAYGSKDSLHDVQEAFKSYEIR